MGRWTQVLMASLIAVSVAGYYGINKAYGGDRKALLESFDALSKKLGVWAMPVFVAVHTLAIAMCFPYAMAFEAGAAFLFGFFNGVLCVFSAKVLGAALAFAFGRALFRNSEWASDLVHRNKYFSILNKGVAQDGWKFVILARFSPVPSYIINYGLAATDVRFFKDFLLPTIVGGLPMILQNTSMGSLGSATLGGSGKSSLWSYILPVLGMCSGVLISWRVKKYATDGFSTTGEFQKQISKKKRTGDVLLEENKDFSKGKDGKAYQRKPPSMK